MNTVKNITSQEIAELPERHWNLTSTYTSLILVPSDDLHESGYPMIHVVGVRHMEAIEVVTTRSDAIHMVGCETVIDILPKSKFVHVMAAHGGMFEVSCALSSLFVKYLRN